MDIVVSLWHVQDTGVSVDKSEGKIFSKTHLNENVVCVCVCDNLTTCCQTFCDLTV